MSDSVAIVDSENLLVAGILFGVQPWCRKCSMQRNRQAYYYQCQHMINEQEMIIFTSLKNCSVWLSKGKERKAETDEADEWAHKGLNLIEAPQI